MSNYESDGENERAHLADVEPGAGCAEIWERLSEQRAREEAPSTCGD